MFEMSWQDLVLSIGNAVFFIGLLPSIFSDNKPSFWTSIITAPFLSLFVIAFYSLELYMSALGVAFGATAWWMLAFQKWKIDQKKPIDTSER